MNKFDIGPASEKPVVGIGARGLASSKPGWTKWGSSFFYFLFFPECVAKGSRLTWESEGRAVFAGRCFRVRNLRNRSQPSATVRKCSNPAPMALPLGSSKK